MEITATQIFNLNSAYVHHVSGELTITATKPLPPERAIPGCLVYASDEKQYAQALAAKASIIIATAKAHKAGLQISAQQCLFEATSISHAMAEINALFDQKRHRWADGISPKAEIDPSAILGDNVSIGPFTVIGKNVVIGSNVRIGPNCIIERNAQIGSGSLLHGQVFVGAACEIGARCEIHAHTTIGSDGFGYATLPDQTHKKISQLGIVVIEDDVEIGANCAIDRSTLTETRIQKGTKLDNLIHVAHNCNFGKNGLFTAGFATAGSTTIGDNFKCGGCVSVVDHITITDNVTIGGRSVVTKDILNAGAYTGYPLQPWKDGLRTLASLPMITELRKELAELRKKLKHPVL